jgi:hypothetical protein
LAETGASAFVPAAGAETVTRDVGLFDPHRPSATQFEKGEDIMNKADREQEYRKVWRATNSKEQDAALDRALDNQGLTEGKKGEKSTEQTQARKGLNASSGTVSTTGAWAVSEICKKVRDGTVADLATSPESAAVLIESCKKLQPLFSARESRIASSVNVEIVQIVGTERTGAPTRLKDYTENQYQNVMSLYLKSALQVDQFPEITTHYWIDKKKGADDKSIGDHYDPRCFNLSKLYLMIRTALGHGVGSTYGITPNYEKGKEQNVWWDETACGGKHP